MATASLIGHGSALRPAAAQAPKSASAGSVVDCDPSAAASPFIPVDSWIYPAVMRLYSMGIVDNVYLGVRPWTWGSLAHMLEDAQANIDDLEGGPWAAEAQRILDRVNQDIERETPQECAGPPLRLDLESAYSVTRAISGTPLRDSFHLGSSIINDYGRPYQHGFNNYSGMSGYATAGRFALYLRGEFQGAPSASGYSAATAQALATVDETINPLSGRPFPNQATIPTGPIGQAADGRFLEAYISAQILNHVISFGKQDDWLGPAQGASMAYSNNAENIYALHINRIEPLSIPILSRLTGPFRYEFLVGQLRGHTRMPNPAYDAVPSPNIPNVINPGNPWVHVEKISFRPTRNLEFGFGRTAIFGGKGHSPVTLHTFLHSFFSTYSPGVQKFGRDDPGARFASFDFSYRLPYLQNWLTLYADSEVHDDVSPVDAPRRAGYRAGLYLSHLPGMAKIDLRAEGVSTEPAVSRSVNGQFMYWEEIEKQGYTNQGQLFGDWIGREDKGGQAWAAYHLSGNEYVQLAVRNQKAAANFIRGGTTLNDVSVRAVKWIGSGVEVDGQFTLEHWKAPIYLPGQQTVTATTLQVTWFPKNR